ncbi:MAG: substrate-binding domain-containing protein [Rhizobiaceae bacterium]|nr:substrate-binding domain-containing protein [Rhizobiaceae bacterium]
MNKLMLSTAAVAVVFAGSAFAQSRDQIKIVGSSTVFPYTQAVSEEYANKTGNAAPVVESTGTGGGFKVFCGGIGPDHPDITGASRAVKSSELELCAGNGVTDVSEALIGYDGLSIAHARSAPDMDLTEEQIFLALAAELPDGKGGLMANPNQKWSDIDASLPDINIIAFGPPPTSGTRDAFVELVMHDGCSSVAGMAELKAADGDKYEEVCSRMRQDGPFVEAGENDNLIVQRLESDPNTVGIFGYSFLYENSDKLKPVAINGIEPNFDTIADGSYPVARPLFFYVKNAHRDVIPGLNDFIAEYMSEEALGPDGYLAERGLTPLSDAKRAEVQDAVLNGKMIGG